MKIVEVFDPQIGPLDGWPPGNAMERAYLEAFAQNGAEKLISNLRTNILGIRVGDRVFPVTVNQAEYGDSYVCLPHTVYALYAKAELRLVDVGPWSPLLGVLADLIGIILRNARINKIIHVNNWMLSTNLHAGWTGDGLRESRVCLAEKFPGHIIAIRSINEWSDKGLAEHCRADGWLMLPSRQIYVTDDINQDWKPRRDVRQDLKLYAKSCYQTDTLERLSHADAERIAALYRMLYLDRYSTLNPAFTPKFIEMTHRSGIFRYRGLRDARGTLVAIAGCFARGGVLTTPILGYDTARPRKEGLYRLACILSVQIAEELGAVMNNSAGAADFKRQRGAHPVLEYSAFYVSHLSWFRRAIITSLEWILRVIAVAIISARGL